ncbi:MAG: KilA-N domain-containing protein [Bacteroidota bacterium]
MRKSNGKQNHNSRTGNTSTINFLETWEQIYNPDFKPVDMHGFRKNASDNRVLITPQGYIKETGAIGIVSKSGRYGGTFAHLDIALEFAGWLEPSFRLFVSKDYQRLKTEEQRRLNSEWTFSRFLSKVNYHILTETIKENIVPRLEKPESFAYSSEADMLNSVVFGMTASDWRENYLEEVKREI